MADITLTSQITGTDAIRKALGGIERQAASLKSEFERLGRATGLSSQELRQQTSALRGQQQALSLQARTATEAGRATRNQAGAIREATGAFQRFNVALNVANSAIVGLGLVTAAREFVRITTSLDKTRQVLASVTGEAILGDQAFKDVLKTANRLGTEVLSTAASFGQFTAAVRGTRLEGVVGERVFNTFAAASAKLGLSTDDTTGVFRALTQMMSKGKVQAEELRGQLGDRMPVALRAMADGLGVTIPELDRMIRRGEVLSEEAIPAMAMALERTFGLDQTTKINTVQAAINRVGNAIVAVVGAIGQAGGAELLREALENIASAGNAAALAIQFLSGEISAAQFAKRAEEANVFGRAADVVLGLLPGFKGTERFIQDVGAAFGFATEEVDTFAASIKNSQEQAQRFSEDTIRLNEKQRQSVLDNIKATDDRRKAEADRLKSFVEGQEEGIRVTLNQARQQKEAEEEARREAEKTQRERERIARERDRQFREQQRLILDTARFERDEGRRTTNEIIGLLNQRLGAVRRGSREELELRRELAAENRRLTEEVLFGARAQEEFAQAIRAGTAVSLEEVDKLRDGFKRTQEQTVSLRESMTEFFLDMGDRTKNVTQLFQSSFTSLKDTISEFIQTGKFSFGSLFDSIKKSIADFLASEIVSRFGKFLLSVASGTPIGAAFTQALGIGGGAAAGTAATGGAAAGGGGLLAGIGAALGFGGTAAATGTATAGAALGGGATAGLGGFTGATITVPGAAGTAAGTGGGFAAAALPFAAAALPIGAFLFRTMFGEEFNPQQVAANMRAQGVPEEVILGKARLARANQLRRASGKSSELLQAEAAARQSSRGFRTNRQTGGDLIAVSPTTVTVGETGPERLSVDPMGGRFAMGGGPNINISIRADLVADAQSEARVATRIGKLIQKEINRLGRI